MIYILHGDDNNASYQRLRSIVSPYASVQKTRLASEHTKEDLFTAIFTADIFNKKKIVICENFLSNKKVDSKILKNIPSDKLIIFWEHTRLLSTILGSFGKYAKVEHYKPKAELFWFLDSIGSSPPKSLSILKRISSENEGKIMWYFSSRLVELILAKLGAKPQQVEKINDKRFDDWQWQIIVKQAKQFDIERLKRLFGSALRIDFNIKSGKTSFDHKTLISALLLKYLSK
ncbi:hypothetical protein HYW39_02605 [Candidatus Curtissbacteria bacterium]|nr:hypothetical protein [Candidatus Curtissbacteria bacterium]